MKSATILGAAIGIGCAFAHPHGDEPRPQSPNYYAPHGQTRSRRTPYPTYYPTSYAPTGGGGDDADDGTKWPTYSPTRSAPVTSDDQKYTTAAPTGSVVATAMPIKATTTTTTTATTTTATAATTAKMPACPNSLDGSITIDAEATLAYAVVPSDPPGSDNGILCGRLEARNGDGWIGLAVSRNGKMIGSEAILGIPGDGSVLKYELNGKGPGGVVPMEGQTLRDVSITVDDDGTTVMEFTKLLVEDGEIPILEEGANAFLHARGGSSLGFHFNGYLSFRVDFSAAAEPPLESYDLDFNDAVTIDASDGRVGPNDTGKDVVNGVEFRPSSIAEAATSDAPSNGFAAPVAVMSLLLLPVLPSMAP